MTLMEVADLWHGSLMIYSGYLALSAVGIVVGFLAWKWLQEKFYLYFSLYLSSILLVALFGGFPSGFANLGISDIWNFRVSLVLATFTNFSYFLFICALLNPKTNSPGLYRILLGIVLVILTFDIYAFVMVSEVAWNLRGMFLLLYTLLNLVVQVLAIKRFHYIRWYVLGIFCFLFGNIPFVLMNSGILSSFNVYTASIPFVGVLLQTVLFIVGLLERLRHEYTRNLREARIKLLGTTAAEIFHELISPLTIIMVSGMRLKDLGAKSLDLGNMEEIGKITDRIEHNIQRVGANIEKFRSFTGVNKVETPQDKINARDIINGAVDLAKYRIEKKGCHLEIRDGVSDQVTLVGSIFDLEQVIANLLTNAADAIQNLEVRWIHLETFISQGVLEIRVTDSGAGISKELREQIFDEFFTTKNNGEGAGIGLHLCKRIVEKYQGSIFIDEHSPHTCFVVRLPVT